MSTKTKIKYRRLRRNEIVREGDEMSGCLDLYCDQVKEFFQLPRAGGWLRQLSFSGQRAGDCDNLVFRRALKP